MASMVTSDLDDSINISVFEQSSPESLRSRALAPPLQNHSRSTSDDLTLDYEAEDDYFGHVPVKQWSSSRSSISSFPSSVIHTIPVTDNEEVNARTPSRSLLLSNGRSSPAYKTSSNSYLSAFRHPNSVRALQLESEYADSDSYSITRSSRHRRGPKVSHFSPRSPGSIQSSPTKRSSRPGTPQNQRSSSKLKKEFPLVLLHCTFLPPATTTRGSSVSEEVLEAVLPEDYRKRWRTLQDKVVKNTEVKQRGVLIAHPRDDYDLLEERLLEALELERPRIRKGHYIGTSKSDSDSGFESSSQNGTDDGSGTDERDGHNTKDKCPDCGKSVSCKTEQDRTWEVKIFAANGLMRSGAWSAAWEQMEKIDVEVAVWMPEDVRFEVEERLKALQAMEEAERPIEEPIGPPKKERTRSNTARLRHDERMREIYGEPEKPRSQEEIDGLAGPRETEHPTATVQTPDVLGGVERNIEHIEHIQPEPEFVPIHFQQQQHQAAPQADFLTFMKYHFHMIVNDQRNLAIVLLSALVLFFSVQNLDTSNKSSSQQSEAVQSVSTVLSSTTETSVVRTETPVVSYITTTILANPSSVPTIAPPREDTFAPQDVIRVEDYAKIPEAASTGLPTNNEIVESTTETPSAELNIDFVLPVLPLDDQQAQLDSRQEVFEVEENVEIEEKNALDVSDKSKDVGTDHQVVASLDSSDEQEPREIPAPEVTFAEDLSFSLEEQAEVSHSSNDTEEFEAPDEQSIESGLNKLSMASDSLSSTLTADPHPESLPTINSSIIPITINLSTPESLFSLPEDQSPSTSPHCWNTKDTTPFASPLNHSSLLSTRQICMATEHGVNHEHEHEGNAIE